MPGGAIYGLIGPNGAGKTTAIDLIFGLGKNDAGQIRVLGLDHQADGVSLKRRAAYVSPDLNFQAWGKVGKAIRFVRGFYPGWDDAYCGALMKAFHLADRDQIATLSFGARTKLSLLLALARRPEVLILDEPITGLDAVSKQQLFGELLKAVEGDKRTVLISSHGLSDIERFADHIGMIKDGKLLLDGRTDEVVDRYRFVEFFTGRETPGGTVMFAGMSWVYVFVPLSELLAVLRQLRFLRTLPISATRLAAVMIALTILPLFAVGALVAGVAGLIGATRAAIMLWESFTFILAPASLCVFFIVWRGEGMQGYALLAFPLFGFLSMRWGLMLALHRAALPFGLIGAIVALSVLLAFVLTRGALEHGSRAYRVPGDPLRQFRLGPRQVAEVSNLCLEFGHFQLP